MLCLESGITGGEGLQMEAINVAFVGRVWIRVSGELGAGPALPLTIWMTLGKLLKLLRLQFPHL